MNSEIKGSVTREQALFLRDRRLLEIRGVADVVRFNEDAAVFSTDKGILTVEGAGLHVQVLNPEQGIVTLDGRVDALLYDDEEPADQNGKTGFFSKLFR